MPLNVSVFSSQKPSTVCTALSPVTLQEICGRFRENTSSTPISLTSKPCLRRSNSKTAGGIGEIFRRLVSSSLRPSEVKKEIRDFSVKVQQMFSANDPKTRMPCVESNVDYIQSYLVLQTCGHWGLGMPREHACVGFGYNP